MIQFTNLTKSFGAQTLFSKINLKILPGQKIGLMGRNGTGKSTLFKIILEEEGFDEGELSIPKHYKIGTLRQHLEFSKPTVLEECVQVLSEDEQYNFYKVEKLLFGLGFTESDLEKDPLSFSGGYQIRINLAKLLATEPNMLLLDEPTNYLDIVSLRWLKKFIREFDGEVILITHDRDFMDAVTTHTMGIQRKSLEIIKGNSTKFYETLALNDETYEKTRLNQEKKKKELEEFVARNKARASTAALAQSKQKQLDKMEDMEKLDSANNLSFDFTYKQTPAKMAIQVEDVGFGYKENEFLFRNLSFTLENGQCLAIIGKNGKGKSTLLNYIANELDWNEGKVVMHPDTTLSHFGQTNIERLHVENTIEDEITSVVKSMSIAKVRGICGTMMFSGELAEKKISVLSGGERSRVMLGKIIATPSNLLLLDEPTNHLDMQSIESLCGAIENFKGSTIMVTHSELLLRRLATSLIIFHKGKAEFFDGTYDEFLEKVGWEEEGVVTKKVKPKKNKKEQKAQRTKLLQERNQQLAPLKKEYEKLEKEIEGMEEELEELNKNLLEASSKNDNSKVIEYSTQIAKLEHKVNIAFEKLECSSNEIDEITLKYKKEMDDV